MTPRDPWREIDPTQFNEGVLYLPEMVEIQPKLPGWGLLDMPDLQSKVYDDRPHSGSGKGGKLLCLMCMARDVRRGRPRRAIWMYLRQQHGRYLFCHFGSGHTHPEHTPESDEHRALVEREVRTCQQVGASVSTEVLTAKGRRRADFVAVGPEVTLAGEIQRSFEPRQRISQRQRDLARGGTQVLWTTDHTNPDFLNGVPGTVKTTV